MAMTQDNLRASIETPLGKDALRVTRFYGEESVSGLFHFTVECVSEDWDLDFKKIVGKHATLGVLLGDGVKERLIDGLVTRFSQGGTNVRMTTYFIELRPWFYMLTLSADAMIFQELAADKIIEKVFKDNGFTDFKSEVQSPPPERVYCVQYNETHYDFVCRLMEEEGIFYFFKHEKGKHTLILADKPTAHKPCENLSEVKFMGDHATWQGEDWVTDARLEQQVVTGKFTVDDFSFEIPSTDLGTSAKGTEGKLEFREYPGGYLKKADGDPIATRRIEELELPNTELRGTSHVRDFTTGFTFKLKGHDRKDINSEWVLRWVHHYFDIETYKNNFRAFDKKVPFRPKRTTRKPRIQGSQTAVVVGKSGEEIWTDKFGRIKVQFHWDRKGKKDEKSSCWVRVQQGWAGKKWGMMFIPRIGMEVVVTFEDGDPDRPIVTGCIYNAEQTVPYALPKSATQSTIKSNSSKGGSGFNEIRFEDKKDKEEIYIHAQKDMKFEVLQHWYRFVKRREETKVNGWRKVKIGGADLLTIGPPTEKDDTPEDERSNREVLINEGDDVLTLKKGDILIKVQHAGGKGGNVKWVQDKNFQHHVKKDYELKIDGNLKITVKGDIIVKGKKSIKFDAGKDIITKAKMMQKHDAGTDMKFKAKVKFQTDATMIVMKAKAMAKFEAGAKIALKAAMLDAKGAAMAKVVGGGMLMLKGGLAKIN
ncbi:MAG: type VI secretion system secreted protein VgrG [Myxococcota bacterium]|jgi:type VI secretion system secreted protein VgrG